MTKPDSLRSVMTFYILAVSISWLVWSPLVLSRSGLGVLPFALPLPWTIPGTLGPPLAALFLWQREKGGARAALAHLTIASGRRLAGSVASCLVVALTFVVGTAVILSRNPPFGWQIGALSLYAFHAVTTLLGGPVFEEWGWRGYAQPRLQAVIGPLPASLIVGLCWGLWHLPLFLVPAWSSASAPSYIAMVTLLSVVMAWGFNLSRGWIFAAIAMHFTYNASSRVLGGFLGDASIRPWPDPVLAITIAFAIAASALIIFTRGKLAAPPDDGATVDLQRISEA